MNKKKLSKLLKILFTNCWTTLLKGGPLGYQSNGINDCIYYDEYLEISWKAVIEDIQEIADEYEAEIVSIERVN